MRLYLCGGSHLAAYGVPTTAAFPVLLSRLLRRRGLRVTTRSIAASGDPEVLPAELAEVELRGARVIVVHRNMHGIPMPLGLRLRAQRLVGRALPAPDVFRSRPTLAGEARRRFLATARYGVGLGLALARLPALPGAAQRFRRELGASVAALREAGVEQVVLTTPVPLPRSGFPLARTYQAAYAAAIRRVPGATVVDVFERWRGLEQNLSSDPLHLTREGHQRFAEALAEALR